MKRRAPGDAEGFGEGEPSSGERLAVDEKLRERATTAREFDPAELGRAKPSQAPPGFLVAALPLVIVVTVNLTMSMFLLPRLDTSSFTDIASLIKPD